MRETKFYFWRYFSLLLFSLSVVSDSLQLHGLQHARIPCPSPSPGACSNSCPLSQWCHPTISFSVALFSSCPQSFPASVFSNESALHTSLPKYLNLNFSISPSTEYSGLISFRVDWLDLLVVQRTLKSFFSIMIYQNGHQNKDFCNGHLCCWKNLIAIWMLPECSK